MQDDLETEEVKKDKAKVTAFTVANQALPTVMKEPYKSLGRMYIVLLLNTHAAQYIEQRRALNSPLRTAD